MATTASLGVRKTAELHAKASCLREEFEHWRQQSQAGQAFEKHHSQIRRITRLLDGLLDGIKEELDASQVNILASGRRLEEKLLTVHAIWEFFRSKLALRLEPWFVDYLRACDEFAWQCYETPRRLFLKNAQTQGRSERAVNLKEPPLTFLNSGWSPYAVGRDSAFQVERASGGWIASPTFQEVVQRLPIPLIGLPWYQVAHLPDALVIGHEMGHVVEWDFGLTPTLEQALQGAVSEPTRQEAWQSWRSEIFADLYGCLAGGPAFAAALSDFLADNVMKIQQERKTPGQWGEYPTTALRLRLLTETLRQTGFATEAQRLSDEWIAVYGEPQALVEFEPDVALVVGAILAGPYDSFGVGAKLTTVMSFPADVDLSDLAKSISHNFALPSKNPRILFAAARQLYQEDPVTYRDRNHNEKIRQLVIGGIKPEVRGTAESNLSAVEAAERQAGKDWLRELFP